MQCSYGCGQEAIKQFKNGRWCCSESQNQCPTIREKNKRGLKNADISNRFSLAKYNTGRKPHNADKTFEEVYGEEKAKEIKEKIRKNTNYSGRQINDEIEHTRREKLSKIAKDRKLGGYVKGSGRGKKTWYMSKIAGRVFLDSSYELAYVSWLDEQEKPWKRNLIKFPYYWEGEVRYYIPDFYLIDEDIYVEIKGYETEKDKAKWSAFPFKLKVLKRKDLRELGLTVV